MVTQTFRLGVSDAGLLLQQAKQGRVGKLCNFMTGPPGPKAADITHACHGGGLVPCSLDCMEQDDSGRSNRTADSNTAQTLTI